MKGKGKRILPAAQTEVAHYGEQGKKRKASAATKSFTIKYMDSKAVLSLDLPEEKLIRILVEFFKNSDPELYYFSVLQYLRLPMAKSEEKTYHHRIDTKEAMSLLFHLTKVREGRKTNQDSQLAELVEIIQSYQINENEVYAECSEQFQERRRAFNNSVYHCRKAIKTIIQARQSQIKEHFSDSEDYCKMKILESRLKQIGLDLFKSMVVGLREIGQNQVQIIYQQCYPSKRCTIDYLKAKIGEDLYLKKKIAFVKLMKTSEKLSLSNTNLIICHLCKGLVKEYYVRCNQSDMAVIDVTHSNSPHIYYKRLIAFDYRYDSFDPPILKEELDYFKYSDLPIGRKFCNRLYCLDCLSRLSKLETISDIAKHKCDFCRKICTCQSCNVAYQLVQGLAHYRDIIVKNFQSAELFRNLMNYINFNDAEDVPVKEDINLRTGFKNSGKEDYVLSYHRYMDRFQQIHKGILKYRELVCTSSEQKQNPSVVFTPQMYEISCFFDQIKQKTDETVLGQSMAKIKEAQEQTKQRLKARKAAKSVPLKQRLESNPDMHNILQKFCVSNKEPRELPDYGITQEQISQMQDELEKELEPATESTASNMIYMKSSIPFAEEDYNNLHVSNMYKLITEREIQFEMLIKQGIFHDVSDPQYFPGKYKYGTYFEDINDYFKTSLQEERPINLVPEVSKCRLINSSIPQESYYQEQQYVESKDRSVLILQEELSQSESDVKREEHSNEAGERLGSAEDNDEDEIQEICWQDFIKFKPK